MIDNIDVRDASNNVVNVPTSANVIIHTQNTAIQVANVASILAGTLTVGTHAVTGSGNFASTVADGANITVGAKADAKSTATDTTPISAMSVWKQISASVQSLVTSLASTLTTTLVPATSGGLLRNRTLIPNNTTAIVVKGSAGQVYKIRATNNSDTPAYIKLYDATSATVGVGTPVDTIMIPAGGTSGAGITDMTDIGWAHATGITYIVTTGIADNNTTAPAASAYVVTVSYK